MRMRTDIRAELLLAACSNALALLTFRTARRSRSVKRERTFKPMKHLDPEWRNTNRHLSSKLGTAFAA